MNLLNKIIYFSVLPAVVFGVVIFLIGWFGGISLTKSEADIPSIGMTNLPFTNLVVDLTKFFSILYFIFGILYALFSIYKSQKSPGPKRSLDLVGVFIIIMIGGVAVSSSAFVALILLSNR